MGGGSGREAVYMSFLVLKLHVLTGECMGALHYAKLTGQRSVGIPDENGTTFSN